MDDWEGTGWSDAKEQDYLDAWAVRMRNCPIKRCRRMRVCHRHEKKNCPALATHPLDAEEMSLYRVAIYHSLKSDVAYADAYGAAAHDAMCAARALRHDKQARLAWKRAKARASGALSRT